MRSVEEAEPTKGVAELYDRSSSVTEDILGDHLHTGIYFVDGSSHQEEETAFASLPRPDLIRIIRAAQVRTIDEALRFAAVPDDPRRSPKQIVDVGCGFGGTSKYVAKKYGATCHGITLSPVQAQKAQALAAAEGLANKVFFQVADALEQPFPDGQFELVWSLECGEHIHDKRKVFFSTFSFSYFLLLVAAPGATIIILTWCHRDLSPSEESLKPEEKKLLKKIFAAPGATIIILTCCHRDFSPSEESLKPEEKKLLKKICDAYYLKTCSPTTYVQLCESFFLQDIKTADWSGYVTPFWPTVSRALTWKSVISILCGGWKSIKAALAHSLMAEGHNVGLMRYAIITCRKPE
ncbi:hypothetical protein Cgig2_001794 [Carnegiea gigantea]|uniref:Methyltransferase domain-containing protein n=1 Tax=Carnegiea gigantea TaxID=171969 RepID=A0A9Q1KH19_9CARY|nr:hypothetical protein Cgig2_001794 [Carnegiea gigantea]